MKPERILLIIAAALLTFWFVWFQWRLILLAFAGFLLAIILHTIASWVERRTPLSPVFAYLATLVGIAGVLALLIVFLGPRLIDQITQVGAMIPNALAQAETSLRQTRWGTSILNLLQKAMSGANAGSKLTELAADVVHGVVDCVVVLVIGFFGALNPRGYREGVLHLFPVKYRGRVKDCSTEVVSTLRYWLLGQMVPMAALAIASMISLWALGVHLAFTLGLLTGVMVFIPYLGTILSGIPAILLAFQKSPRTAIYVLILYGIFHMVEGYLLTPLVQRRAVRLPPILTVLSEFCLWSFAGFLGVAVAAPLTAVGLALVKDLYPEDAVQSMGHKESSMPRAIDRHA